MSLITTISNMFRREPAKTTLSDVPATSMDVSARFRQETDRRNIILACKEMYKFDPRVKQMHRVLARDLVRGGFMVKTQNTRAAEIATQLQTRLGLNQKCEDWVRLSARDGDSFLELGIDEQMNVAVVSRKPVLRMHRATNTSDQFTNPAKAFWMDNGEIFASQEPGKDALWFAEWQIIHARWDHDEESRYGSPMMAAAIGAYRRVTEGEMDVSVRRKTRSGVRYHHVIEGSPADVESYKEVNKAALSNPFAAVADFFTNKKGQINVLQGDGDLDKIADILHHIETLGTASDVPLALLAYGNDLNRDVLGEKKAEYEEQLEQGREWLTDQIIKPLLERQWLLQGILPESVTYSIIWRPRIQVTPALIRDLADALMKLRLLSVSAEDINAILAYFLPGVAINAESLNALDNGDSERFAGMLKGLSI
jgi:hypothetical protein